MKNLKRSLALFAIFIVIGCFSACGNKEKCERIKVMPGDTITFRYPNIPENLMYEDVNITFYQPHTDSVVIVYNAGCK